MNSQQPSLILASQSPRRQQLLNEAGWAFTIDAPDDAVEQAVDSSLPPEEFVVAAALAKATAIGSRHDTGIVLAADTVADCDGEILGKPNDRSDAARMLTTMSNRKHRVLTGVCLWDCVSGKHMTRLEQTLLKMDKFPPEDLEAYLDSRQWLGKAGAFGYQDGLEWIHIVDGLASNVVGLPVERLNDWLAELFEQ